MSNNRETIIHETTLVDGRKYRIIGSCLRQSMNDGEFNAFGHIRVDQYMTRAGMTAWFTEYWAQDGLVKSAFDYIDKQFCPDY